MRAWVDFECGGCGLFLTPNFEIARVECRGGCGASFWVCMKCSSERGGVRCGPCRVKWQAEQRERDGEALDRMILGKLRIFEGSSDGWAGDSVRGSRIDVDARS